MTEIMPFPENNIVLFYWTAPSGSGFFLILEAKNMNRPLKLDKNGLKSVIINKTSIV